MKLHLKAVVVSALLALGMLPALAAADGTEYQPEVPTHPSHEHEHQPKGHAYGYYCKGESKKHVEGQQGTPFSACVRAAKQAHNHDSMTAREACKGLSKKHVKGQKGTPFSACVKGVAQMNEDEAGTES